MDVEAGDGSRKMQPKLALVTATICAVHAFGAVIVPGATWTDTSGNVIQAHGGGFLKVRMGVNGLPRLVDVGVNRSGRLSTGLVKTSRITVASLKLFLATRCVNDLLLCVLPPSQLRDQSSDLTSWTRQNDALTPISGTNISTSNIVERPKGLSVGLPGSFRYH